MQSYKMEGRKETRNGEDIDGVKKMKKSEVLCTVKKKNVILGAREERIYQKHEKGKKKRKYIKYNNIFQEENGRCGETQSGKHKLWKEE